MLSITTAQFVHNFIITVVNKIQTHKIVRGGGGGGVRNADYAGSHRIGKYVSEGIPFSK